jgi:hypothetical protein
VTQVLKALSERDILGGYHLSRAYPELDDCVLVCATETKVGASSHDVRARIVASIAGSRRGIDQIDRTGSWQVLLEKAASYVPSHAPGDRSLH